ncbi:hypothetical protein QBC42DRAFT_257424 [Cladorrhinum samala]|uniref:Secreted protein n=1 Tax=Cladorrhinum samala TaxID=585594 RepID=A0AAV9I5I9_9PEZI|nr:hypothetical protein QBC42DRAFT_257424 [Cladorrhinum samala]
MKPTIFPFFFFFINFLSSTSFDCHPNTKGGGKDNFVCVFFFFPSLLSWERINSLLNHFFFFCQLSMGIGVFTR